MSPQQSSDALMDTLRANLRRATARGNPSGWRASSLALAAGLNESAVRDILRGRSQNPGIVTLHRLALALGVETSALYTAAPVFAPKEDA